MDLALFSFGPTGWGDELLAGLDLTLRLAVTSILTGTALGLVSALGEVAPVPLLGRLLETVNMVLRSVPELLSSFSFITAPRSRSPLCLPPSALQDCSRSIASGRACWPWR
jgi:ABC-type amino acid transport system permease subunit